jgi:predicted DNA-binding transcriptional regulator YafY
MTKRDLVLRYIHIMNKLRTGAATFEQIDAYLSKQSELQGGKFNISPRQFQRDLEDIESIFEVEINYDFKLKVYAINEEEYSEMSKRRMEALDTFNALKMDESSHRSIHFEKRKPQGTENFYGMLHAIKNQLQLSFTYQKYWEDQLTHRTVEPYALKEFRNRWYLLALDMKDQKVKSFAFDRLTELEISTKKFRPMRTFDVNDYYKYCFGIISPTNHKLEEVILSFDPFQGKYIKSLPLHGTQEILLDNQHETRIRLKIYLTHDFIMEILSHGDNVKVIQPESLITELKHSYKNALKQY